jgi:hypothetical protein
VEELKQVVKKESLRTLLWVVIAMGISIAVGRLWL